jgi:hypothetical protein
MSLMDILLAAQGGALFANAGRAAGLGASEAKSALQSLCPAIAAQLRKRAEDEAAFDSLLDLLEDGDGDAFLDDAALMDDPEVMKDGQAILDDLYGSQAAALRAGKSLAGVEESKLKILMSIAAASVLAALVRTNAGAQQLAGTQQAQGSEGGGLLGTIISAVVAGMVKGAARSLAPKRRRRRTSGYASYRRRPARRRRTKRPSLDSIFRDILSGR